MIFFVFLENEDTLVQGFPFRKIMQYKKMRVPSSEFRIFLISAMGVSFPLRELLLFDGTRKIADGGYRIPAGRRQSAKIRIGRGESGRGLISSQSLSAGMSDTVYLDKLSV